MGADFIKTSPVALMLGDNIFYGAGLARQLQRCTSPQGGIILAYHLDDPSPYGVVTFDEEGRPIDIEEKPTYPSIEVHCSWALFL